jgi:hypothetical protein
LFAGPLRRRKLKDDSLNLACLNGGGDSNIYGKVPALLDGRADDDIDAYGSDC